MSITQPDSETLSIETSAAGQIALGAVITLATASLAVSALIVDNMPIPVSIIAGLFAVVGICLTVSATAHSTTIRRGKPSNVTVTKPLLAKSETLTFDLEEVVAIVHKLHRQVEHRTTTRSSGSRNRRHTTTGNTRIRKSAVVTAELSDSRSVTLMDSRRKSSRSKSMLGSMVSRDPLVAEAEHIAEFVGAPLHFEHGGQSFHQAHTDRR